MTRIILILALLACAVPASAQVSAISELTSGANGTNSAGPRDTASVTPTNGSLVLVMAAWQGVTLTMNAVSGTSVSNCAEIVQVYYSSISGSTAIWRCVGTGSAGVISMSWDGSTSNQLWKVLQVTGADPASNFASATSNFSQGTGSNSTTGSGGTLAALSSGSAVVGSFILDGSATCAAEDGTWTKSGTEEHDGSPTTTFCGAWQLTGADTTPTVTWGSAFAQIGVAVEIKQAPAATGASRCLLLGVC